MSREKRNILKPNHEEPGKFWLNYILLPYGEFYPKTKPFLEAKKGDILRFFNGPDFPIESVMLIKADKTCDFLSRMRYGITWDRALAKWTRYAMMEGHGRDILSKDKCILVVYENKS